MKCIFYTKLTKNDMSTGSEEQISLENVAQEEHRKKTRMELKDTYLEAILSPFWVRLRGTLQRPFWASWVQLEPT